MDRCDPSTATPRCRRPSNGARAVTGVSYGTIYPSTVPDSPLGFVTSGLTPEEQGTLAPRPAGLRSLRRPARPRDAAKTAGLGGLRHSPAAAPIRRTFSRGGEKDREIFLGPQRA